MLQEKYSLRFWGYSKAISLAFRAYNGPSHGADESEDKPSSTPAAIWTRGLRLYGQKSRNRSEKYHRS